MNVVNRRAMPIRRIAIPEVSVHFIRNYTPYHFAGLIRYFYIPQYYIVVGVLNVDGIFLPLKDILHSKGD
jgi:hypothetical protein